MLLAYNPDDFPLTPPISHEEQARFRQLFLALQMAMCAQNVDQIVDIRHALREDCPNILNALARQVGDRSDAEAQSLALPLVMVLASGDAYAFSRDAMRRMRLSRDLEGDIAQEAIRKLATRLASDKGSPTWADYDAVQKYMRTVTDSASLNAYNHETKHAHHADDWESRAVAIPCHRSPKRPPKLDASPRAAVPEPGH